jgi:cytochrome c oxidase subunit 4
MSHDSSHGNKLYLVVWGGLLLLTILEVVLAYTALSLATMLVTLIALSLLKAGLIVAYFMHLRFEKLSLVLVLVPATVFCIVLFALFFPDSLRILELSQ